MELHCVYVNTIKSPQMSTWFNLFHSGRQLNRISPKWLSISCLCVTSGYGLPGNSDPLSHSLNSHITFNAEQVVAHFSTKKMCGGGVRVKTESNLRFSDVKLEVFFLLNMSTILLSCENIFPLSLHYTVTARWGPGPIQACQWHSIPQQLLVAVTSWPAFLPRRE